MALRDMITKGIAGLGLAGVLAFTAGCNSNLLIRAKLNSHPSGASVYQNGEYLGRTPKELHYYLDRQPIKEQVAHNGRSDFRSCELVVFKEGYLPAKGRIRLRILPGMERKAECKAYALIILKRDPKAPKEIHHFHGGSGAGETDFDRFQKGASGTRDALEGAMLLKMLLGR